MTLKLRSSSGILFTFFVKPALIKILVSKISPSTCYVVEGEIVPTTKYVRMTLQHYSLIRVTYLFIWPCVCVVPREQQQNYINVCTI